MKFMAGEGGTGGASRQLDQTPTWAVAGVCAVIILISIALEKILHKVGTVRKIRTFDCQIFVFLSFYTVK